jgi:aminoglycoside phosphotransferase (APT) family kinase protein
VPHTHDVAIGETTVRKTYVSWTQREHDREWDALVHLDVHAPGLAPRPVSRFEVDGRPGVEMGRVEGAPLDGVLSARQTVELVIALERLFAVPVPDDLGLRANDPAAFQDRFRAWLEDDRALTACDDPDLVELAVAHARSWLVANPPTDDWVVEPVLALGDGNLDNVLWDGHTCRLIDWEEYGVSDRAYELADVVEHASSRLEGRLDATAFLAACDLTGPQTLRVEHHRRMFACFWLAMLLPGNPGWHRNPPGSVEDQARWVLELLA